MTATVAWQVPMNHPAFAGHFPGTPIVPGVLLLDMAIHAIATQAGVSLDQCEVRSVKFLSPARPGDEVTFRYDSTAGSVIRFEVLSGLRKLASGEILPLTTASPEPAS